jgi:hypothetical protein
MDANITGMMRKPVFGWETRVAQLAVPSSFYATVGIDDHVYDSLSPSEQNRLDWKLALVEKYAAIMAAGMLKGTLKYDNDVYSLDEWISHIVGEGADQSNYQILLANEANK